MTPGAPIGFVANMAALAAEAATGGGELEDLDVGWDGGWWRGARRHDAHPGRVGGKCRPWAAVVHTTDMHPDTWKGLLTRLQRDAGKGNGAHFWIGRSAEQGIVQTVGLDRNANHAGGATYGRLVVGAGRAARELHPNAVTVGIEVHCAGAVIRQGGQWYAIDRSKDLDGDGDRDVGPTGAPLPAVEVDLDPRRPGRGWHRPSAWQVERVAELLAAIGDYPARAPVPATWSVKPNGKAQSWAPNVVIGGLPVLGHVTLDPADKLDPWPPLSRELMLLARG